MPFWVISFFFFQAEDGIRDFHVTGVQTCLFRSTIDWGDGSQPLTFSASEGPINGSHSYTGVALTEYTLTVTVVDAHSNRNSASKKVTVARSEERRVGKECRSRWMPDH